MFIIHFVRGVSQAPQARSLNLGVVVVALCNCEVKFCSICTSNILISSDIILPIMTLMFVVPGRTGPSGGGGNSGIDCRVVVVFLLELDPSAVCVCVRRLVVGCSPTWEEATLEPRGCKPWLASLKDSRVWLAASPRCLLLLNILHMGCSSRSMQLAS